MIDADYSLNVVKKNKHLISQFFEYAIDNKWVQDNPTRKVLVKVKDRKVYSGQEKYKALTPESRRIFLKALNEDESNFLKPLCYVLLFAGLRIGEALALQWKNVNFEEKTLKIERSVTQIQSLIVMAKFFQGLQLLETQKRPAVLEKSQSQILL